LRSQHGSFVAMSQLLAVLVSDGSADMWAVVLSLSRVVITNEGIFFIMEVID